MMRSRFPCLVLGRLTFLFFALFLAVGHMPRAWSAGASTAPVRCGFLTTASPLQDTPWIVHSGSQDALWVASPARAQARPIVPVRLRLITSTDRQSYALVTMEHQDYLVSQLESSPSKAGMVSLRLVRLPATFQPALKSRWERWVDGFVAQAQPESQSNPERVGLPVVLPAVLEVSGDVCVPPSGSVL